MAYHEGRSVPQDDKTAVKWLRLAAEQGDAGAQRVLGLLSEIATEGKEITGFPNTQLEFYFDITPGTTD